MPADASAQLVVVWDFDQTIVSDNTDTYVFERLAPDILNEYIKAGSTSLTQSWTNLMDSALEMVARRGITSQMISDVVAEAPFPSETRQALALLRDTPHACSAILSDANTLYIDSLLQRWNLSDAFKAGVRTNPAEIAPLEDGLPHRVRVSPFQSALGRPPHSCPNCPSNMCKGELLDELLAQYPTARFAYVGDGSNDFCPSARLGADGVVLPRVGYYLHEKLARSKISANVLPWNSPRELLEIIQALTIA